jgi:hypothetical protein
MRWGALLAPPPIKSNNIARVDIKGYSKGPNLSIDQVKSKLFPKNGLQERSVNLFQLCAGGKVDERIEQLHGFIDPFEKDFIVIRE